MSGLGKSLGSAIFVNLDSSTRNRYRLYSGADHSPRPFSLQLADAYLSTRCGKPTLISPSDLQDYYVTAGFSAPDLVNLTIGEYIEERSRSKFVPHEAAEVIKTLMLHVLACYRVFAQVTTRASCRDVVPTVRG